MKRYPKTRAIRRLGGVHGMCGAICCYSNVVAACAAAQAVDPISVALWRDTMYRVLCRTWASSEAEPAFRQWQDATWMAGVAGSGS